MATLLCKLKSGHFYGRDGEGGGDGSAIRQSIVLYLISTILLWHRLSFKQLSNYNKRLCNYLCHFSFAFPVARWCRLFNFPPFYDDFICLFFSVFLYYPLPHPPFGTSFPFLIYISLSLSLPLYTVQRIDPLFRSHTYPRSFRLTGKPTLKIV